MIVDIKEIKGLFTNADREDIPPEFCTALKNLRNSNGKSEKTFGLGLKLSPPAGGLPTTGFMGLWVYIYTRPISNYVYLLVSVDSSTKVVTVIVSDAGTAWQAIGLFFTWTGTYYHDYQTGKRNPIVQDGEVLRILPGAVGKADGTNESKGIWLGFIERRFFDELYAPQGDRRNYDAPLDAPSNSFLGSITYTKIPIDSETRTAGAVLYKYSYIYDGEQESLQSDAWPVSVSTNFFVKISIPITTTSHNWRITGIKVYRGPDAGSMGLIETINLLRLGKNTGMGLLKLGESRIFLSNCDWDFDGENDYRVKVNGTYYLVGGPTAGKHAILTPTVPVTGEQWDQDWVLERNIAGWHVVDSAATGAYAGDNVCAGRMYYGGDGGVNYYSGNYLMTDYSTSRKRLIIKNTEAFNREDNGDEYHFLAFKYDGTAIPHPGDNFFIIKNGNYYISTISFPPIVDSIVIFDFNTTAGSDSSLAGYSTIRVNGKFSRMIGGRMIHANVVHDPGGAAEVYKSGLNYSELLQPDVVPLANFIPIADREGGEITGLVDMFGSIVVAKEMGIFKIDNSAASPANWAVIESAHNIGNIATEGMLVVAGDLYVCAFDGIYRLRPNNLAATDQTPTVRLRVSEQINDVYEALIMAQRKAIVAEYNQNEQEVMFTLGSALYAFNIDSETWRQIDQTLTCDLMAVDQDANLIALQASDVRIYSTGVAASVKCGFTTKVFHLSHLNKEVIRELIVTYKSVAALTISIYLENSGTATATFTLAAASVPTTKRIFIKYKARKVQVGIDEAAASTTAVEIHRAQLECDTIGE